MEESMNNKSKIFQDRYVLGEGYPWALGAKKYTDICLVKDNIGVNKVILDWPIDLWIKDLPRYRLVLEKINE